MLTPKLYESDSMKIVNNTCTRHKERVDVTKDLAKPANMSKLVFGSLTAHLMGK